MKKIFLIILIMFYITACSLDKVVKHHGVHYLENKQKKLTITNVNKNDVKKILGPPSTVGTFDNDIWVYIERKTTVSDIRSLGKKKLLLNNVLLLEFDNRGLLVKKSFYDKSQMKKINFSKKQTDVLDKKDTFMRSILTSLKYKINDPLGKRKAK